MDDYEFVVNKFRFKKQIDIYIRPIVLIMSISFFLVLGIDMIREELKIIFIWISFIIVSFFSIYLEHLINESLMFKKVINLSEIESTVMINNILKKNGIIPFRNKNGIIYGKFASKIFGNLIIQHELFFDFSENIILYNFKSSNNNFILCS